MNPYFLTFFFVLCTLVTHAQIDLMFSESRGYYNNAFTLTLEASDADATIQYTTNGETPDQNIGSTYTNPIDISTTTVIKAIAFTATDTSRVTAHTYIFVQDVLNQPDNTDGYPYATGFSSSIINDAQCGPLLDEAILAIPTMCLSLQLSDYDEIYNTKAISKQAYIEYFEPSTTESYGRPTGVSTYGNSSFAGGDANKKNYRLRFKDEFGAAKYKYEIFGDEAASDFDVLDLRAGSQETIDRGGVQNIHEKVLKDLQIQMSTYGVHGKFTHLYINEIYWGVYTLSERPAKSFGESYFGGSKDDYNTGKATCCDEEVLAIDGTITSYNNMIAQTANYPAIEQYLDVDHFIDYVILCNYGPHGDWKTWNTYAIDNPTANVPFRFFMWDPEPSFQNDWYYTNQIVNTVDHEDIWQPLKSNIDFRMRFADHVECNCIQNDGPLNPVNVENYYDATFQENKLAYLAEAARWGDKNLYDEFLAYRDNIINDNWFSNRMDEMITAYQNEDIYPTLNAVSQNQPGGIVAQNFQIDLSNTNNSGTIYYTTDNTDPRADGGAVSNTAQTYTGSFNLPNGVYELKTRVNEGNIWSAMCPRKFYVGQNYTDVVINEIHYNPLDSIYLNPNTNEMDTVSGKNFEFIELKNTGTQPVYLEDVSFNKGVTITFEAGTVIPAGGFFVIAEDAFWFEEKYGFPPDATYSGKLDNGGENLWMIDPMENVIDTLRYDDSLPWDTIPDEGIYSLALIDALSDNSVPGNWSAQSVNVTPGAENIFIFCDGSLTYTETLANIPCAGLSDGLISGAASGGTPPYTYLWSDGTSNSTLSNLSAGSYTLNLMDANGCTFTQSYILTEPLPVTATITSTNERFYQANDGTASVAVSGGTPLYTYNWSNGASTDSIDNLAPGSYTVTITDNSGCIITESTEVNSLICNSLDVMVMVKPETCPNENDGFLQITSIQNGAAPYTIQWSTGDTDTLINNLPDGSYSLNITDAQGCPFSKSYSIDAGTSFTIDTLVTHASSANAADGSIELIVSNGIPPYHFCWSTMDSTQNLNGILPGVYWAFINDSSDCNTILMYIEVEGDCPATVIQQNQPALNTQVYNATGFIQSNGMIDTNKQVSFKAGDYIEMTNDFEVTSGAAFEALIEGCD